MFFRKPGLPILMVRMPDGSEKPYWNTFYQEVRYTAPDAQDLMKVAGLQYTSAQALADGSGRRWTRARHPPTSTSPVSRRPAAPWWTGSRSAAGISARWT